MRDRLPVQDSGSMVNRFWYGRELHVQDAAAPGPEPGDYEGAGTERDCGTVLDDGRLGLSAIIGRIAFCCTTRA